MGGGGRGKTSLIQPLLFLLKWLNQASKVSDRVLGSVDSGSFYAFFNWILEMFRQCGIGCFPFDCKERKLVFLDVEKKLTYVMPQYTWNVP